MEDNRFYVIVPETVQSARNVEMSAGKLIAQGFHIGRMIEHYRAVAGIPYQSITAITLAARNSREMHKLHMELESILNKTESNEVDVKAFFDHHPEVFGDDEYVMTAIAVGPVTRASLDAALGHLELY